MPVGTCAATIDLNFGWASASEKSGENDRNTVAYKKRMENIHGEVKVVNKTGIKALNKKYKKTGTLTSEDFEEVNYKKVDMTNHKVPVKKKW